MFDFRPILLVLGVLLMVLSAAMLIPVGIDLWYNNTDWQTFLLSAFCTGFVGVSFFLTSRGKFPPLTVRHTFILTTVSWGVLCAFGALPFYFSVLNLTYAASFFEAMSGLTTTGSTAIIGLDTAPRGILMWRMLLHWLGGIGIIVVAIAILPMLKIGGMQLFRTESSDKSDKILPRARQISFAIVVAYTLMTVTCTIGLYFAGMNFFDALCHAMSTVSTGGFANYDQSAGHFDSLPVEIVLTVFMLLNSLPYVLFVLALRGNPMALVNDPQVRGFFAIVLFVMVVLVFWMHLNTAMPISDILRNVTFTVASVISTTGFSSVDYSVWGPFITIMIFLITVTGGCTGSTSGGIKIFRYQILAAYAKTEIHQLIQPHGVFRPMYNGKFISEGVTSSVMSFFVLFAFSFMVIATLLSLTGLGFITSLSAAATALANVGPGLGPVIGPVGNFATISPEAQWILSAAMLLGRLELFTVYVLFVPYFWKD